MNSPYLEHGMSKAEKKAYNHKYYEEHKNYWAERGRIKSYRPYYPKSDVADYSDHPGVTNPKSDAIARMEKNKRYYQSSFGKNLSNSPRKWTLSPEYDQKNKLSRPGQNAIAYTVDKDPEHDPYRFIDSNITYKRESDFYNTPESFSSPAAKRSYRRSQAYGDNEIVKTLKSYEKIRDTYAFKNDLKLAAAKGKNALRKAVKKLRDIKLSDIQNLFK